MNTMILLNGEETRIEKRKASSFNCTCRCTQSEQSIGSERFGHGKHDAPLSWNRRLHALRTNLDTYRKRTSNYESS